MILWFKALHIISFVAWFAGLFYMFRLFVYHTENKDNPQISDLMKLMAKRLYLYITTPAMISTVVFGVSMLVAQPGYLTMSWLRVKIIFLILLLVYHFYVGWVRKRFHRGDVFLTSKECRVRNEIPTLFLIAIVLLAVLRPSF